MSGEGDTGNFYVQETEPFEHKDCDGLLNLLLDHLAAKYGKNKENNVQTQTKVVLHF